MFSAKLSRQIRAGTAASVLVIAGYVVDASRAAAHGIAGNRYFVGTLSFDDPAVNDEFSSTFSNLRQGDATTERALNAEFSRLLTPDLSFGAQTTAINRNGRGSSVTGFDTTRLTLKALLYRDDPHETLVSAGFGWGLPGTGTRRLGAQGSVEPGIFFGKGLGDLPDGFAVLRPFGIAGAVSFEHPTGTGANSKTVHWGTALEFSTLYLTERFTGGPPKEEPLFQWVPLVEFAGDTPSRGGKTRITANPGVAYVGDTYQIAAELIVPLNREAGRGVGITGKLLLFLDDLLPTLFGKPLFTD